jgi:hypothetical protein
MVGSARSTLTALWFGFEQVVQLPHDMVHELCHLHGAIHLHAANYRRLDGVFTFLLHGHVNVVVLLLLEYFRFRHWKGYTWSWSFGLLVNLLKTKLARQH